MRFVFLDTQLTFDAEHRGVNNRMLEKLGWVIGKGNRETPRNGELRLRPEQELLKYRTELLSLMENPHGFVARIFGNQDNIWVGRCSEIFISRAESITLE